MTFGPVPFALPLLPCPVPFALPNGFEKADPKQLYRRFIETTGVVTIQADRIAVRFDRRCHNPILREAALDRDPTPIPWLGERSIGFTYH
jgi:hypothetical protein